MADPEKVRIKPLENGDDYRLWRIRIEAACDSKGLEDVLNRERNPFSADDERRAKFENDKKKASGIIVAALSNEPLRIVRGEIGKPHTMLKKLNDRYDSKSAASRIAKMTELVSLRYDSMKTDIGDHIDKMAGTVEQLAGMQTAIPNELSIALLIASIHVPEMAPITAAVKTLPDDLATWETVTARLIEEHQSLKALRRAERSTAATRCCEICQKRHFTKDCWLNPRNPKNRLQLVDKNNSPTGSEKSNEKKGRFYDKKTKNGTKTPTKTRAAIARALTATTKNSDMMMLDSGTTSHMTPDSTQVEMIQSCAVPIALGDDSTVHASGKGIKSVIWNAPDGQTNVRLSETLVAEDLAMSLCSVPALTSKGMAVLFLPEKALIIDIDDNMKVIGVAPRGQDNLYCIHTNGSESISFSDTPTDRAMMAITRKHAMQNKVSSSDSEDSEGSGYESDPAMPPLLTEDEDSDSDWSDDEDDEDTDYSEDGEDISSDTDSEAPNMWHDETVLDAANTSTDPQDKLAIGKQDSGTSVTPKTSDLDTSTLWHKRLGHQGTKKQIEEMINEGILPDDKEHIVNCDPCVKRKFKRFYRGSLTKEKAPGRIHADLIGKVKPTSEDGYNYLLTVIDEATRYLEVYPLVKKSDASDALIKFMHKFERQTGHKLKALHTDGGSEFYKARHKIEDLGVKVTTATPYTPSSNGLVERTQGTLLSLARACLVHANIPLTYWVDAIVHVAHGRNVIKHSVTGKSPYVALFNTHPQYAKHLRPFGCKALAAPNIKKMGKFAPRLQEGIHLGHVDGGLYKILSKSGTFVTKHVRMFESEFPGLSNLDCTNEDTSARKIKSSTRPISGTSGYDSDYSTDDIDLQNLNSSFDVQDHLDELTYIPERPSSFGETDNSLSNISNTPEHSSMTRVTTVLPDMISTDDEPTMKEALTSAEATHWKMAISEEFGTLQKAKAWIRSDEKSVNPLPSGIILRLKRDKDGMPARFKARLVARGNLQPKEHISCEAKYAPVVCFDVVRILLALSVAFGWSRHQVDIKGAFLHADLPKNHQIWLRLPSIEGIEEADGSVVKLIKSLYGLKEAPKLWYQTLARCLKKIGFQQLISSECLFILRKNKAVAILLAYVDDLGLFGDEKLILFVKKELCKYFEVTDVGKTKVFLGVHIEQNQEGIRLSQMPLVQKIIEITGMASCKPTKTALPTSHCLYEARSELTEEERQAMKHVPFKEILGSLLFLSTRTRPDIAVTVSMLGKFASDPAPRHWKMMKHLVRYLKGTADYSLLYKATTDYEVQAWSDADWGRDQDKRRSRTGYMVTVGNCPVIWTSKLQPSVALSTCEAEFYALSECVRDVKWARQMFKELGIGVEGPTTVYQDNLGTIHWTEQVQGLRKVKHVGLRYSFVKETVQNLEVEVEYVPSEENIADCLTKALAGPPFEYHRQQLCVVPTLPRGGVLDMLQ